MERTLKEVRKVYVEFSGVCNFKCSHCVYSKREKGRSKFMDLGMFENALEQVLEFGCGANIVPFLYGEFLLHPKHQQAISLIRKRDMNFNLATNASVPLTKGFLDVLRSYDRFTTLKISLYGFTSSGYVKVTGTRGFDLRVYENVQKIFEVMEDRDAAGCPEIELWCQPSDWTQKNRKLLRKYFSHYIAEDKQWVNHKRRVGNKANFRSRVVYFGAPDSRIGLGDCERKKKYVCSRIFHQPVIFCDGDISYCCANLHNDVLGNISVDRLVDVWRSDDMQDRMIDFANGRQDQVPLCRNCEYVPDLYSPYLRRLVEGKTEVT